MGECLYVVMPAYNEENNIVSVVNDWYKILDYGNENSRLVIADGGSSDKTLEVLYELKKDFPKLEVFSKPNTDHGTKIIWLYKYAISSGAKWIFQTDSDGQTRMEEFKSFWESRNDYDVIIGNRVVRGDGLFRKFVEIVVCILLRIYFGVSVKDANAPFRLMKAEVVNKYMDRFRDDYELPNIMLTTFFSYYKEKMCYKRITFKPRQGGKNSMNAKRIIKIGLKALGDFRDFKKNM